MLRFVVALLSLVAFAACRSAPVGVTTFGSVSRDSAPRCARLCTDVGMALDSLVIMADNVGCVCRAAPPPGSASPGATGAASAGGMAAIMMAEEAEAARRSSSSSTSSPKPPSPPPPVTSPRY